MKGKSLYFLAIASFISLNSFGFEIIKGHLISHKEWTTGGVKASLNLLDHLPNKFKNKNRKDDSQFVYTNVTSKINHLVATVGVVSTIEGFHSVFVVNTVNVPQIYSYLHGVCVDSINDDNVQQCAYYFDKFLLEPEGYVNLNFNPQFQVVFNKAGEYQTYVTSRLYTIWQSQSFYDLSQESYSENSITVSDGLHMKG